MTLLWSGCKLKFYNIGPWNRSYISGFEIFLEWQSDAYTETIRDSTDKPKLAGQNLGLVFNYRHMGMCLHREV